MTRFDPAPRAARLRARLQAWGLEPDGGTFETARASLAPVRRRGVRLMVRICDEADSRSGNAALRHFAGAGAVRLFRSDRSDSLVERAAPGHTLDARLDRMGDLASADAIGRTVQRLHARRIAARPAGLVPLEVWFAGLINVGELADPVLARARSVAIRLLDAGARPQALHGDLHHGNLVWDEDRGWLAIDPKGLWGERAFEFAPAILNPIARPDLVLADGRAEALVRRFASLSGEPPERILGFAAAYAGLSAMWSRAEGDDPSLALALCAALIGRVAV